MEEELINLTPHTIVIRISPGITKVVEPSGIVARIKEDTAFHSTFAGVDLVCKVYGKLLNLPDEKENVKYIVSNMVRIKAKDRSDLVSPGDLLRDSEGYIIGAKNLITNDIGD